MNPPDITKHASIRQRPWITRLLIDWLQQGIATAAILTVVAVDPVLAQSAGEAFCETSMAETIHNIFTIIQFGGPLIGGVLALGAVVLKPIVRSPERKKELRAIRNQGIVWGVIVAPLGTTILQFLLNNVVAGGTSCGF